MPTARAFEPEASRGGSHVKDDPDRALGRTSEVASPVGATSERSNTVHIVVSTSEYSIVESPLGYFGEKMPKWRPK